MNHSAIFQQISPLYKPISSKISLSINNYHQLVKA